MHPSFILLTLVSIGLIIIMLGCFIWFTKSRRKEEEELMEQVQFQTNQTGSLNQDQQNQLQISDCNTQLNVTPVRNPSTVSINSQNMNHSIETNDRSVNQRSHHQHHHHQNQQQNLQGQINHAQQHHNKHSAHSSDNQFRQYQYEEDSARNQEQRRYDEQQRHVSNSPYITITSNPYQACTGSPSSMAQQLETRNDITQQINSAIIGSTEAEFQNDFIQVFPMYQIAPQPEKNTTPYLT